LWTITGLGADDAFDDVEQHGDEPVQPTSDGRCSTNIPVGAENRVTVSNQRVHDPCGIPKLGYGR
jgi:hypothetical protein